MKKPLALLLLLNLLVGLLTFRNYGLSWDEPLFYDYANSIWQAYTPAAWQPGFDFEQIYGRSPQDHKIYGPAYLLLARPIQQALAGLAGLNLSDSWHWVNFLTFQVGLAGFYRLARRWLNPWVAVAAAAFWGWQPVFWGHAFINPKDIPFMVFFWWALTLGLEWVDSLPDAGNRNRWRFWAAAATLGAASAIRVIGPLAGVIVLVYFLHQRKERTLPALLGYAALAALAMLALWPYLWANPLERLLGVLKHMSDNPTELAVLFLGQIFRANEMPRRYLPQMLALTLTEPTWFLATAGLAALAWRKFAAKSAAWVLLLIPAALLAYTTLSTPAMYDGFRHFFFLTPPFFLLAGFALQWLYDIFPRKIWLPLVLALLLPGIGGIVRLHPYEYAYYNQFAGGVGGAFRVYETEYWLTCYREAVEWVQTNEPDSTLYVQRELELAAYYADGLRLLDLQTAPADSLRPGDLLLMHTRANLDTRSIYRKLPLLAAIGREGADFCLIKRKE